MTIEVERFSGEARRVLSLAVDEAKRMNMDYVGTEHLLLGILRQGEGLGARILESFGITLKEKTRYVIGKPSEKNIEMAWKLLEIKARVEELLSRIKEE